MRAHSAEATVELIVLDGGDARSFFLEGEFVIFCRARVWRMVEGVRDTCETFGEASEDE